MNTPNSLFVLNQAKALRTQSANVAMLEVDMRSIRRRRKLGFTKTYFDGVLVYRISIPCGPVPYLLPIIAKMGIKYVFKRIIKTWGNPDLIHAHFGEVASWAISVKKKYDLPLIVTEHNSGMIKENRTKKTEAFSRKSYAAADKVIAVGSVLKKSMSDMTGKEITVIPNVLPSFFCLKDTEKHKNFTFVSVGNLIRRKRFDITINAFAIVNRKLPDTRLKIIGTGELEDELKKLVADNGMAENVEFFGLIPNDELPDIYNVCHCFILLSMVETFGVVYAEALACGLPVIATKCGGPEDFINNSNGVLIPTDDLSAAVDAMEYMNNNIGIYNKEKISTGIMHYVGEEAVGASLIEVYNDLQF